MGCKKGKKSLKPKPKRYRCEECGVVAKNKKLCSPVKIKKKDLKD